MSLFFFFFPVPQLQARSFDMQAVYVRCITSRFLTDDWFRLNNETEEQRDRLRRPRMNVSMTLLAFHPFVHHTTTNQMHKNGC